MKALAYKNKAVSSTAQSLSDIGFSDSEIALAVAMIVSVTDENLRYRVDGQNPTASNGHQIVADDERMLYDRPLIQGFRCIAATGTSNVFITLLGA